MEILYNHVEGKGKGHLMDSINPSIRLLFSKLNTVEYFVFFTFVLLPLVMTSQISDYLVLQLGINPRVLPHSPFTIGSVSKK